MESLKSKIKTWIKIISGFIATCLLSFFLVNERKRFLQRRREIDEENASKFRSEEIRKIEESLKNESTKKETIDQEFFEKKEELKKSTEAANKALDIKMEEFKEEKIDDIKKDPEGEAEKFANELGIKLIK